jgi:16S rRNA (uracil1498-N3)-methyltransferase
MLRRVFLPAVRIGDLPLPAEAAHHLFDVLRLAAGAKVEVFDAGGNLAEGVIVSVDGHWRVRVGSLMQTAARLRWTIASATPKGNRADWMVEKLSEFGTAVFIPLQTARSVVHPEGEGKRGRWERLARESAEQSRRGDVMRVEPLAKVEDVLRAIATSPAGGGRKVAWYFSTSAAAIPATEAVASLRSSHLVCFIGPEGGWTDVEIERFDESGAIAVRLTQTVLRIETAAVAAAAILGSLADVRRATPGPL